MKKLLRSLFTLQPFEKILVSFLSKYPDSYVLTRLRPSNQMYRSPAIRNCRRHGINYKLDISDYQNWLLYFYCSADSSFGVLNYIKQDDVIIDVGGNIGQTAMMMASRVGANGKVYSFEPFPSTFQKFSYNLSLNTNLQPVITLTNCALGDAPATLKMFRDYATNSGSNRIAQHARQDEPYLVDVSVLTLDNFVSSKELSKIDFIKIDVEGFEMNVLKGAVDTLKFFLPSLFIELNDKSLRYQGSSSAELIQFLTNLGYKIYEDGSQHEITPNDIFRHIDIICKSNKA